jgi:hypothetical protein
MPHTVARALLLNSPRREAPAARRAAAPLPEHRRPGAGTGPLAATLALVLLATMLLAVTAG